MNTYQHPDYHKFVVDMNDAGYRVEHYCGRFYWEGPAVRTDDLQETIRDTTVSVQWDQLGKDGWIVYPKAYDLSMKRLSVEDAELA